MVNTYVSLMYEFKKLERYLRVNLLGPGPRLIKKIPGRGLTKVEKHCTRLFLGKYRCFHNHIEHKFTRCGKNGGLYVNKQMAIS